MSNKDNNQDEIYKELQKEKMESLLENKYVRLSEKGAEAYKNLQYSAVKQFMFWVFVGNVGAFVLSKFINFLPLKTTSPTKLKRYRYMTFFTTITAVSYHGYKVSRFQFIKEKKLLLNDPENILQEPADAL
jgi:hypothetical protein